MRRFSYDSSFPNREGRKKIIRKASETNIFYAYEWNKNSLGSAAINSETRRKQIIKQLGI